MKDLQSQIEVSTALDFVLMDNIECGASAIFVPIETCRIVTGGVFNSESAAALMSLKSNTHNEIENNLVTKNILQKI